MLWRFHPCILIAAALLRCLPQVELAAFGSDLIALQEVTVDK